LSFTDLPAKERKKRFINSLSYHLSLLSNENINKLYHAISFEKITAQKSIETQLNQTCYEIKKYFNKT
jgi:hypothetical protein